MFVRSVRSVGPIRPIAGRAEARCTDMTTQRTQQGQCSTDDGGHDGPFAREGLRDLSNALNKGLIDWRYHRLRHSKDGQLDVPVSLCLQVRMQFCQDILRLLVRY